MATITPRQSYGFFRVEILGALLSIQMIWLLAGVLVYEAIARFHNGSGQVQGFLMFFVSVVGLLVNIAMLLLFGHDHGCHSHGHSHGHSHDDHSHGQDHSHGKTSHHQEHEHNHHHDDLHEVLLENDTRGGKSSEKKQRNLNIQGAYLHVLGDLIQSLAVMIGGGIIWYKPEWKIIDLICTLVFSVIVLGTTINTSRNILEVLMESTPREIDATKLEKGVCEMEEVVSLHELHIWAITPGKILLACHVKIKPDADADMVLDKIIDYIEREYKISHVTIQIERQ